MRPSLLGMRSVSSSMLTRTCCRVDAVLATRDAIAVRQPESFGELFVAIKEQPQAETTAHDEPQQSAYDDDQTESMDVDEP